MGGEDPAPAAGAVSVPRESAMSAMLAENRRRNGGRPPSAPDTLRSVRINVHVTEAEKARYTAAYQDMPHRQRPESFSAFVKELIEAKVRKLEIANNNGEPYEGSGEKLPPGRKTLRGRP